MFDLIKAQNQVWQVSKYGCNDSVYYKNKNNSNIYSPGVRIERNI